MRFNTDRALFDAFPTAPDHIKTEPADLAPEAFLNLLLHKNKLSEALSFCAYLLRRREAVAWGCECVTTKRLHDGKKSLDPDLMAANAWVRDPSEQTRGAAYERWAAGDQTEPAAWLALAAAWSGGGLISSAGASSGPAGPHLTAVMVRTAFLLMLHSVASDKKAAASRDWIAAALQHAKAGS